MESNALDNNIEALTSFLILDHLEKAKVSPEVRKLLAKELAQKGLFQNLLNIEGKRIPSTYDEFKSQVQTPKEPILKTMLYNQFQINKQRLNSKQEVDHITQGIQKRFNIFDSKSRRKLLEKRSRDRRGSRTITEYPIEIFTHYWNRFKSMFGHSKKEQDPDDPINGSPVYNLIYDKTGKQVISAADDGMIKIWSTASGELVNTLIGHNSDINATALSECGTYLASCSNDGIVRIWDVATNIPISVFKDHTGIVCSLNFFNVPFYNNGQRKLRKGLASASDDGTIKIYFEEDWVNNGGVKKPNQKHLTLKVESSGNSKGFSSIEFHPEGYVAAGTNWGSIVIWNKLSELEGRNLDKHRIIKNEHSKDCHLTLWNKDGTMLLSASFDGTAKVWPWNSESFEANRKMASIFIFDGELGKSYDIKCCAVAWSVRGRFAVASFCKRLKKREENGQVQSNIQIYDAKTNRRSHKFDKTYDGALFENYIFILEPHPFNEAILMSADYDGKIIIWDIDRGVMLNVFIENCAHLGCPLLHAPILDGRFSPDGLSFCVANFYGSITLYGYGERDLFLTSPTEQFYTKEFKEFEIDSATLRTISLDGEIDMHLVEKGPLCTAKKRTYGDVEGEEETFDEVQKNEFDLNEYYRRFIEAVEKNRQGGNVEPEGINSKDCLVALKIRLHELIQQEIEKALEQYYTENIHSKPRPAFYGLVDTQKIWSQNRDKLHPKFSLRETTQHQESTQPAQSLQQEFLALQEEILAGSDYDPPSEEERTRRSGNRPRRRRARRLRTQREVHDIDEDEFIPEDKEDDDAMEEEEEEEDEEIFEEKAPQNRRSRRLVLDDEEEEEEEEKKTEERRYATRRSENRNISGRRNRNLVSDTAIVREAPNMYHNLRTSSRHRPQNMEEELSDDLECTRCGLENAKVKCAGGCGRVYHSACSKKHGKDIEFLGFQCLHCQLRKRRSEKIRGAQVDRSWANPEVEQKEYYVPQEGDLVTYVFQAHEDFILGYFDFLRFSKNEILPFEKRKFLQKDNVCKVVNIKYQFPLCPKKYRGHINILMKLTLEVIEAEGFDQENMENKTFTFTYFPGEIGTFVFPRQMYLNSIKIAQNLVKESQVTVRYSGENKLGFLSEIEPKEEGPFPDSYYCLLKLFDHSEEGGYVLRRSRREITEQNVFWASPWDVIHENTRNIDAVSYHMEKDEEMSKENIDRILKEIEILYQNNENKYGVFMEEVDKTDYPAYLQMIPLEMNIMTIQNRLSNTYYRHLQAVISDMQLISKNCCIFNDPSALISKLAKEVSERLTLIAQGKLDPEILSKTSEDQSFMITLPAPEKLQERVDKLQEEVSKLKKRRNEEIEEEHDENSKTLISLKMNKEEEHTEAIGMKLRPKKIINFKNLNEGEREEREEPTRRSQRQATRKEDFDFLERRNSSQVRETSNSAYSTRLRSRRHDSIVEEKIEKKEDIPLLKQQSSKISIPEIQKEPEPLFEEEIIETGNTIEKEKEDENHGIRIILKKLPPARSTRQKTLADVYVIESIEGIDGQDGKQNGKESVTSSNTKIKPQQEAKETKIEKIQANGSIITLSRGATEDDGYRTRLRKPGKSFSDIYKEEQEAFGEDEEDNFVEENEVKGSKLQQKYSARQLRKQRVQEEQLEREAKLPEVKEQNGSVIKLTNPSIGSQRETRSKRNITTYSQQFSKEEPQEEFEEAPTKIRLTLPKVTGQESPEVPVVMKRYNTRNIKK